MCIRDREKKVHNKVVEIENISKSYEDLVVINKFNMTINSGDRIGIIGENGIGKTTLVKCLIEDNFADNGTIKWSDNCSIGYFAQNHSDDFKSDTTLMDWIAEYSHKDDDLETIRGTLGRLLFSQDDINKPVSVLSGQIIHLRVYLYHCLLYTSPSPRDLSTSRMPSSA